MFVFEYLFEVVSTRPLLMGRHRATDELMEEQSLDSREHSLR